MKLNKIDSNREIVQINDHELLIEISETMFMEGISQDTFFTNELLIVNNDGNKSLEDFANKSTSDFEPQVIRIHFNTLEETEKLLYAVARLFEIMKYEKENGPIFIQDMKEAKNVN